MTLTPKAEAMARSSLLKVARWGVAHEHSIHYTEDSRRDDWLKLPAYHLPLYTDCSGFVTLCYRWAGLPDPSGLNYKQLGYTGTLLSHCHLIQPKAAKPGDLIVYGPGTGEHVVIIMGGANPGGGVMVISHGQESGPAVVTNLAEKKAHDPPVRFLRNPIFN